MTMGAITGLIPIAVAGGLALKFTQAALSTSKKAKRRSKKRKVSSTSPFAFGDFRNVSL